MIRRISILTLGAALAATALTLGAQSGQAQTYPDRPIRVIVPYAAGGVGDGIMRLLAPRMEQKLGQKLVIESKPGAAGTIGTTEVTRAAPDGYTILVAATNNYVINQFIMKVPFDPLAALTPVTKVAEIPIVLFSNPSVPAKNLREFLAYAKANPGKLNYGSPSNGTVNHLFIERLKQTAGINMQHIPYKGSPPAVLALLANDIQLFPVGLAAGGPHLKTGKLTAIAVATEKRLPTLPDVGTVIEAGFPGFTAANWWGMGAPKGTPEPILRALHEAVADALKDPNVVKRFEALSILAPTQSAAQFAASLKDEAALWADIVKRGNIRVE
jgi:tripartite-type tricarboxylate transporter receptor subunit TctC